MKTKIFIHNRFEPERDSVMKAYFFMRIILSQTQGSLLSFAELFWFMMGDKKNTFFPVPVLRFEDAYMVFCKSVQEVKRLFSVDSDEEFIDIHLPSSVAVCLIAFIRLHIHFG